VRAEPLGRVEPGQGHGTPSTQLVRARPNQTCTLAPDGAWVRRGVRQHAPRSSAHGTQKRERKNTRKKERSTPVARRVLRGHELGSGHRTYLCLVIQGSLIL
jgi:hypothetical protein